MEIRNKLAVTLENVNKYYYFFNNSRDVFRLFLKGNNIRKFQALKDINFTLQRGDVLGVIGSNGAGKSTLLKILAAVCDFQGKVACSGSIHAILEAGIGVNQYLKVRDIIRRLLILFGQSERTIPNLTEDILEFSELEDWRDRQFFTLSSGMQARLLFAILTSAKADIWLIDEFISAGDEHFVGKSYKRIKRLARSGKTFIIAGHAWDSLRRFCNLLMWIEKGEVIDYGTAEAVTIRYLQKLVGITHSDDGEETKENNFDPDPNTYQKFIKINRCDCKVNDNSLLVRIENELIQPMSGCRILFDILLDSETDWCFVTRCDVILSPEECLDLSTILFNIKPLILTPNLYRYCVMITPLETDGAKQIYDKWTYIERTDVKFSINGSNGKKQSLMNMPLRWVKGE